MGGKSRLCAAAGVEGKPRRERGMDAGWEEAGVERLFLLSDDEIARHGREGPRKHTNCEEFEKVEPAVNPGEPSNHEECKNKNQTGPRDIHHSLKQN
ncbi:unnamed protein product [Bursaphelenchus xylophilus]|uniref:(pine wood nematode) hypothetical protein n=1 Tax=Bursaphelenchus xylophilus TaxID=6326 RepID=A0A1I7RJ24_BURXY|nr:unnamed protein product [Bursaphelenchus xylophilus]CAG9119279.1 unnamed protein product [Bursaphelenchus xylophilus]